MRRSLRGALRLRPARGSSEPLAVAGPARRRRRRAAGERRLRSGRAGARALLPGLTCAMVGQRVSRCMVCRPHQRQYFLNSIRSGEFRFDLFV